MATKTENSYDIDNRTGINHEGEKANTPVERLTASSIVGDSVENPEGEKLGSIDNLMINISTGMVEYAVVEFGSFLGIGGKLFAIPFIELKLIPDKRIFLLDRDREFLEKLPGFDKKHWPDTNDHYYNDVNLYWRISSRAFYP
jgi:sporulation protein YlmC with PRC-barrel domain